MLLAKQTFDAEFPVYFATPEDIYDPRTNLHWRDTGLVSLREFMDYLQVLYCRRNMLTHPELLTPGIDTDTLIQLLDAVPEEHHKYFAWAGGEAGYIWCLHATTSRYWDRDYCNDPHASIPLDLNKFNNCLAAIHKYVTAGLKKTVTVSIGHIASLLDSSNLACHMLMMMTGDAYMRHDDSFITASQISRLSDYRITAPTISAEGMPLQYPSIVVTSKDGRSHLYKVFSYATDVCSLIPGMVTSERETPSGKKYRRSPGEPLYGIELELSCSHQVSDIINSQEFPFFICKRDGSITGSQPMLYECVTVPMDRRSQRVAWGKFFSHFWDEATNSYAGFDNSTNTSNGMHIHISKDSFFQKDKDSEAHEVERDNGHLQRFTWLVVDPLNNEFITAISERGETLGEYARVPGFGRLTRKQAFQCCVEECREFRGAVNIRGLSSKTIEVRIFKGIVSYATLLKNLEFVDAAFWFTQTCSYQQLTVKNFIGWVNSQPKTKYKALKLFLAKMDQGIITRIGLTQRFVGCRSEEEALEMMKKLNIKGDQVLLDYLNKKFKTKRNTHPFCLIDGEIVHNPYGRGFLRPHEKELNPFQKAA